MIVNCSALALSLSLLLQIEEYTWVLQEEVPLVLQDVFNILTVGFHVVCAVFQHIMYILLSLVDSHAACGTA